MKKVICLLTLTIILSLLNSSCKDDTFLNGGVPPIPIPTTYELYLEAKAHEETFIAQKNRDWSIYSYTQIVGNDTTYVVKDSNDAEGWPIITGDWFRAEKKEDGKELYIQVEENTTDKTRKVIFTFQVTMNGWEYFFIEQEAKKPS